ncbi:hypothetical protein D9M72_610290 [compost metagenome]
MSTTARIEDALKARIAAAAQRAGKSSHAFILDTLAETVDSSELEEELHRLAEERWALLLQARETVSWTDSKAYLEAPGEGGRHAPPALTREREVTPWRVLNSRQPSLRTLVAS